MNKVLAASALVGVKIAAEPETAYTTVPGTTTPPGAVSVNVVPLIVAGFIASLKVAATAWLVGTPVAPLTGFVETTEGAVAAVPVLKVQE